MEFQGKKATHDFLSLYNKDSSFPLQDSRPPPQGFFLKTHDFLKPLEKAEEPEPASGRGGYAERTPAAVAHVLPGGIGTYSISHVAGNGSGAAVKPERVTCVPARGPSVERKPEPNSGSAADYGSYAGVAFTMWDASAATAAAKENGARGQWSSPFAACATTSFAALSSSRNHSGQEKKRLMESGSRSSRGFDEEDDDDDEFGKREGTSKKRELTVKVDGKGGNDQRGAMTPRSKHSATEQRRRSKINDRFQILRELIPHSDQKRDKASFLLEVIEYIQFLQERVQKYESTYPGFNEENAKLMPWNNSHVLGDGTADPSQLMKNGPAPAFIYSATDDMPTAPAVLSTAQNPIESEMNAGASYKSLENPVGFASKASASNIPLQPNYGSMERGAVVSHPPQRLISDIDNLASQSQSQWLRPSDYSVSSDVISEQEELTVDEGTINVSTAYSQNILNTLTQALESSGLDLSQANISVQINLGKRATRRATATTTMSSAKDLDDPACGNRPVIGHSRVGSSGEESEQLNKKRKMDNNN